MDFFGPATRAWFERAHAAPTEIQRRGWEAVARGAHCLLVAPTGSGKTLAAFLWALDSLGRLPADAPPGVRVLYVSPLKALVHDVDKNLRAPLAGIAAAAAALGLPFRPLSTDLRTGDTPQDDRRRQLRRPADVLATTPESLFLLLGSRARETLRTVRTVIVDEVHALAPTKRGSHLALSLERLTELATGELTGGDPQRIGLSATVRPAEEAARFLGGDRAVEVVDTSEPPRLSLRVTVPVPDMTRAPEPPPDGEHRAGEQGLWAAVYPALLGEIRAGRSTIVFVNSRGLCERLARRLNELAGEELVRAHHGSVSRERRLEIEDALKQGRLRGLVATSSLELGIDMGAVDRVVLVESPGSVARGLQRVGRAGHRVGAVSEGTLYPKHRGDLLECAAVSRLMLRGEIEALRVPRSPLDVLAQQVVALCCDRPRTPDEVLALARRAHPYRDLSPKALRSVLDVLSGRYPSTDFAQLRPLLAWDREAGTLTARAGAATVSRLNAGTIPDRGLYGVYLGEGGPRLGELDEEMVFESRPGDNILLGASTWRIAEITRDRVVVTPAPGEPGRLPFWHGEGPGRPAELGRAVGALTRELASRGREEGARYLEETTPLDRFAAENLAAYVADQRAHTGTVPTDRSVTVERFRDELGDWRVCILSPCGARIHAPWALAAQALLERRTGFEVKVTHTDDGVMLRFAGGDDPPPLDLLVPDPDEVEELVVRQLAHTALFAGLFREAAGRALLLPRRRPDRRSPLWAQRLRTQGLLAAAQEHPDFPIVLECYREALSDRFDLPGLTELLRGIRSREVEVTEVETPSASPFALSFVFAYTAEHLYDPDSPLAERKAQALTLDRNLLGQLLGQPELRELLDPAALEELEAELQHLRPGWRAADPDALHDLLRRLGDLSVGELSRRADADPAPWLAELRRQGRAAPVAVPVSATGEERWIAAEDAGLYRDALGAAPAAGVPAELLGPTSDSLGQLLRRYARTRGPFQTGDVAARFGLPPAQVEPSLERLEAAGTLVRGEIRPGGSRADWCDADVLRRLRRLTLARLRREIEPVDARALGAFLPAWQGVGARRGGRPRLLEVVGQLQGMPLPWSELLSAILPARVEGFGADQLDALCAEGRVVWVGCGALGRRDGRVALFLREDAARLLPQGPAPGPGGPAHEAVLAHLEARGASFLVELEAGVRHRTGATADEVDAALRDLVWAGHVTNDTTAPLRALARGSGHEGRARAAGGRAGRRAGRALAGGRWSLVRHLAGGEAGETGETERALARASALLGRWGVVSREVSGAEDLPGGFGPLYQALRALEEHGRVRRGYFVEGLTGAQFAAPGAVDRLRAAAPGKPGAAGALVLPAVDPASPWGALLPWPEPREPEAPKPRRVPGARVVLVGGVPVVWAAPGGRELVTFSAEPGDLEAALRGLLAAPPAGRRFAAVERVDGVPVRESALFALLMKVGYRSDYRGLAPPRP